MSPLTLILHIFLGSTLAGSAHIAVHDAKAVERLRGAVIHVDGKLHVQGSFGVDQEVNNPFLETVHPGQGPFELLFGIDEKVETLSGCDRHIHHSPREN